MKVKLDSLNNILNLSLSLVNGQNIVRRKDVTKNFTRRLLVDKIDEYFAQIKVINNNAKIVKKINITLYEKFMHNIDVSKELQHLLFINYNENINL